MADLDTSDWVNFRLTDIFVMRNTKSITQKSITPGTGDTPYVTARAGNNGVQSYVSCPQEWTDAGGCILIGGKTTTFSYQARNFCSNDSHNIALYVKAKSAKSENCQLFLIGVLEASFSARYYWGDSVSMAYMKKESIPLPVTSVGDPDWEWMDEFISFVLEGCTSRMAALMNYFK